MVKGQLASRAHEDARATGIGGLQVLTKYYFADFCFETDSLRLMKAGNIVKIRPKCAEILGFLLGHRDKPVLKEQLLAAFWPGVTVSENTLFQVIRDIRSALSEGDEKTTFIMTFPKRGYQWIYADTRVEEPRQEMAAPAVAVREASVVASRGRASGRGLPLQALWPIIVVPINCSCSTA